MMLERKFLDKDLPTAKSKAIDFIEGIEADGFILCGFKCAAQDDEYAITVLYADANSGAAQENMSCGM